MALKKSIKDSTRYTYARVERVDHQPKGITIVYLTLIEKENADESYSNVLSKMHFEVHNIVHETIYEKREHEGEKIDVAVGSKAVLAENEFSIAEISQKDANLIRASYLWIKKSIGVFQDFEDC